jgi:protoporphyrinogen oxidase
MLLIYLVLDQDRFTEFDAHYFPGETVKLTRLSEPKNYANLDEPRGRTVLCAELPCSIEDPEWRMNDSDLGELVLESLREAGLPAPAAPHRVASRRLPQAYPIYLEGYERHFDRIDDWLGTVPNLLSFGRQGLFAHDNTHHALFMAYCASECLGTDGRFDRARWSGFRKRFETHVVED